MGNKNQDLGNNGGFSCDASRRFPFSGAWVRKIQGPEFQAVGLKTEDHLGRTRAYLAVSNGSFHAALRLKEETGGHPELVFELAGEMGHLLVPVIVGDFLDRFPLQ
jgi:hypothetical protein